MGEPSVPQKRLTEHPAGGTVKGQRKIQGSNPRSHIYFLRIFPSCSFNFIFFAWRWVVVVRDRKTEFSALVFLLGHQAGAVRLM